MKKAISRVAAASGALVLVLLLGPLCELLFGAVVIGGDKDSAFRVDHSAGIAPLPNDHSAPLVQVYAARAWSWRGAFAVHTWIATKREDAAFYCVNQVKGWLLTERGQSPLVSTPDIPDRYWMANRPQLLREIGGPGAETLIDDIEQAVRNYPYTSQYRVWPGPNSNTLVAFVARKVPELELDLPATAIGKDFTGILSRTTAGGWQVSLAGLLGLGFSRGVGVELNALGLNLEINPLAMTLDVPGVGTFGNGQTVTELEHHPAPNRRPAQVSSGCALPGSR